MNFHKKHFFNKIKLSNKKYEKCDLTEKIYSRRKANSIIIILWIISFIVIIGVLTGQILLTHHIKTMEHQCYIYMLNAEHKMYNDPNLTSMLGKYSSIFQTDTNNYLVWLKAHPNASVQVIEAQYTAYVEQLRQVQVLSHLMTEYKTVFGVLYPSLNASYLTQTAHINTFYDLLMCLPLLDLWGCYITYFGFRRSVKYENSDFFISLVVLIVFFWLWLGADFLGADLLLTGSSVQQLPTGSTALEDAAGPSYASSLSANLALIGDPSLSTAGFLSQINLPFVLINGTNANTTAWVNIMAQTSLKANFLNSPLYYALTANNLTNIGAAIIDNNRQLLDANITCNLYNFVASLPGNLGQLFFGVPTIIY